MRLPFFLALLLAAPFAPFSHAAPRGAKAPAVKKAAKGPRRAQDIVFPAVEGCPKNRKEWQAKAPKLLIEKARRQHLPIEVPDFSAKLGKKGSGATARATPFRGIGAPMIMVEAVDETESLALSGVLKCDELKHAPALVSLTYVKGPQSGMARIIEE